MKKRFLIRTFLIAALFMCFGLSACAATTPDFEQIMKDAGYYDPATQKLVVVDAVAYEKTEYTSKVPMATDVHDLLVERMNTEYNYNVSLFVNGDELNYNTDHYYVYNQGTDELVQETYTNYSVIGNFYQNYLHPAGIKAKDEYLILVLEKGDTCS